MNSGHDKVTFLDEAAVFSVVQGKHSIAVGYHGGPASVSIDFTNAQAEALCRDLAKRLGLFVAVQQEIAS